MIKSLEGDILKTEAEALVNTVNCVGVMGRGIALQFKKTFPENFKAYMEACDRKEMKPGKMLVFSTGSLFLPKYIINFPTKRHWKGKSRLEDIELGLISLVREVKNFKIKSIAIPPLGCGLGGLDWAVVRPLIENAFAEMPNVEVLLFEPKGAPPAALMSKSKTAPKMTTGRAALISLVSRYLEAAMDPSVTLLEIHKLMYFMQEAGEHLKLNYEKARYGPYASNLRHVLNVLEGHLISGFADGEDSPDKLIELKPNASKLAEDFLKQETLTIENFEKVGKLISGFETAYGMELLATVHWVANRENCSSAKEAIDKVYSWNSRKSIFQEKHIEKAWETLDRLGWIKVS